MRIHESGRITLTPQEENFLEELMYNTGIEIWNASCNQRLLYGGNGIRLCEYHDPLHGKEYKTFAGALTALTKEE
jgi:hypothetical protein